MAEDSRPTEPRNPVHERRASSDLYPHPIIAREGWSFIALAALVAGGITWLGGAAWGLPFWLLAAFIVQFFRDPRRRAPAGSQLVLAPADGRVVLVERTEDPYLRREALKFSVFMNVFNVHSNRSPVDGEVRETWYRPGRFFNAALAKASEENERSALWIRTDSGADVTCVQVAGLIARRILCYANAGQQLRRGERYGFIRFGSRLDLYLPPTAKARVSVGDKVHAGESVLAELLD
jgi:phosphatidylserine decarboxylase